LSKKQSSKYTSNSQKIANKSSDSGSFFSMKTMRWVCVAIAFLFYGNSIKNGYSMDDELVTSTDRQANKLSELGVSGIGKIFTTHSFVDGKQNYEYRPVSIYSFAIEWTLFKKSENRAHISHFINVTLYAVIGILLFQLLLVLFQQKSSTLAAVIVILFMIHPIHSEVVNNIKNRDELLSLIFALLAAIWTFKWKDNQKIWYILVAAMFLIISLLSKKTNLPFLVSVPLMLYFFREFKWKELAITLSSFLLVKVLFNVSKNALMNLDDSAVRKYSVVENPLHELGFIERIPMYFYTNFLYIEKLFLPYPLAYFYGQGSIPIVGFFDWQFYLGLMVLMAMLFFAYRGFFDKKLYAFGILFFLFGIGGAANLLFPAAGIFAERFAFSASIGFCVVIAYLFSIWKKDAFSTGNLNSQLLLPLAVIGLPCLFFSINRNTVWASKKSLYLNDIKHVPNSAKANSMLASEYQLEAMEIQKNGKASFEKLMQKVDSSLYYYEKSLAVYKDYESNLNNRGVLLYTYYFDYVKALELFKHSVKINPAYKEGMLNCANTYAKLAEGLSSIEKIVGKSDSITSTSKNINQELLSLYLRNELFKTLSITKQFELNVREFAQNFSKDQLAFQITANAVNLSSLSNELGKNQFANTMRDNVNKYIQTNPQGIINGIFQFENRLVQQVIDLKKSKKNEVINAISSLKQQYLDSAKMHFNKTHRISPKDKNVYTIEEKFAIQLNDYTWLISIEEQLIKEFPNEQHGPQYVQMGNGYLNLKQRDKALIYFQKGAQEFKKEKEVLLMKSNRSQTDEDRLNLLSKELQNLKAFKEKILKGEI